MPDDLLDSAQKVINDAANKLPTSTEEKPAEGNATAPVSAPVPEPTAPAVSAMPEEPPPAPPVPEPSTSTVPPGDSKKPEEAVSTPVPPPAIPAIPANQTAPADASAVVESLLETKNPEPIVPAKPKSFSGSAPAKRKGISAAVVGVVMLLLLALPVGVYYISQQNQQLADVRSRASGSPYVSCGNGQTCPAGQECHCVGGQACTSYECVDSTWVQNVCTSQGRSWCNNSEHSGDNGKTCCVKGYSCCPSGNGCCAGGGPTKPPGENPTNTPPPVVHECSNLKILSASGTQLTPASLTPGQQVVLAVKGSGTPDQAHFRINGGSWQPSTTKNGGGEYILNWTVPSGVTDFVLEAEVHVDNVWK